MTLKRYIKRTVILILLILLAYYISLLGFYGGRLGQVERYLQEYVVSHQGQFPEKPEDLLADIDELFHRGTLYAADIFIIRYGSKVEELTLTGNKIVDKEGKRVVLIGGRTKNLWVDIWFIHERRSISLELFEEMMGINDSKGK